MKIANKDNLEPEIGYVLDKDIYNKIMAYPKLSSAAKLVLRNLIDRLQGKRYAWPSQARIGSDIGLTSRQVRNLLGELIKNGIISKQRGSYNLDLGKKFQSNTYDLINILKPYRKAALKDDTLDLEKLEEDNE
jgi:hypothetical protein